jgi:hypothetical protein
LNGAWKRSLLVLGLVVAVVVIASWSEQVSVVIVAAAVAALIAVLVHRHLASTQPSEPASEPALDPTDAWIGHLRRLVALNAAIREAGLPADVTSKLEQSIDALRQLVPELNDGYAGSELTWTVNRMASDYLPRIVTPYAALAPAARQEQRAELLRSLAGLEAELETIAELLRNAKVGEFQSKAAFLRARFLDADLG